MTLGGRALSAITVFQSDFMLLTKTPIVIYYGDNIPDKPSVNQGQEQWLIFFEMAKRWRDVVNHPNTRSQRCCRTGSRPIGSARPSMTAFVDLPLSDAERKLVHPGSFERSENRRQEGQLRERTQSPNAFKPGTCGDCLFIPR